MGNQAGERSDQGEVRLGGSQAGGGKSAKGGKIGREEKTKWEKPNVTVMKKLRGESKQI